LALQTITGLPSTLSEAFDRRILLSAKHESLITHPTHRCRQPFNLLDTFN